MINFGLNSASILGILLALLGVLLIPLGLLLRRPFRVENLIQDSVLASVYLLCGLILFLQGWRLDPILQFGQLLLTVSSMYLIAKDIFRRSLTSRG
ncbi:MAG: Ycf66 family protein [Cyanobacteriota bacterium]